MSKKHERWTTDEVRQVVQLKNEGCTWREVSRATGRTRTAAQNAYHRYTRTGWMGRPANYVDKKTATTTNHCEHSTIKSILNSNIAETEKLAILRRLV